MKTLRKQCAVAILTLTMAVSAYAGILQTPGSVSSDNGTTPSQTDIAITLIMTVIKVVP